MRQMCWAASKPGDKEGPCRQKTVRGTGRADARPPHALETSGIDRGRFNVTNAVKISKIPTARKKSSDIRSRMRRRSRRDGNGKNAKAAIQATLVMAMAPTAAQCGSEKAPPIIQKIADTCRSR